VKLTDVFYKSTLRSSTSNLRTAEFSQHAATGIEKADWRIWRCNDRICGWRLNIIM